MEKIYKKILFDLDNTLVDDDENIAIELYTDNLELNATESITMGAGSARKVAIEMNEESEFYIQDNANAYKPLSIVSCVDTSHAAITFDMVDKLNVHLENEGELLVKNHSGSTLFSVSNDSTTPVISNKIYKNNTAYGFDLKPTTTATTPGRNSVVGGLIPASDKALDIGNSSIAIRDIYCDRLLASYLGVDPRVRLLIAFYTSTSTTPPSLVIQPGEQFTVSLKVTPPSTSELQFKVNGTAYPVSVTGAHFSPWRVASSGNVFEAKYKQDGNPIASASNPCLGTWVALSKIFWSDEANTSGGILPSATGYVCLFLAIKIAS